MKISQFVIFAESTLDFIFTYWTESFGIEDVKELDFGKYKLVKK